MLLTYLTIDDFFISRIGDTTGVSNYSWHILVDFQVLDVGGCQRQVKEDQNVLWAYGPSYPAYLKLDGPTKVASGKPATYTVTNGTNHALIKGASVGGVTTDANGKANITFTQPGSHILKATRSDSIRSNALQVVVN